METKTFKSEKELEVALNTLNFFGEPKIYSKGAFYTITNILP